MSKMQAEFLMLPTAIIGFIGSYFIFGYTLGWNINPWILSSLSLTITIILCVVYQVIIRKKYGVKLNKEVVK